MSLLPRTRLVPCPACAELLRAGAGRCPHCGEKMSERTGVMCTAALLTGLSLAGCSVSAVYGVPATESGTDSVTATETGSGTEGTGTETGTGSTTGMSGTMGTTTESPTTTITTTTTSTGTTTATGTTETATDTGESTTGTTGDETSESEPQPLYGVSPSDG